MPRPPLPVGTAGKVGFLDLPNGQVRARAKYRDYDGVVRPVTRYGPTRAAAERLLKEALRDRQGVETAGRISGSTRVRDLAAAWLAEIETADLSDGTRDTYQRAVDNHVLKALGGLLVREADVPAVDRFLRSVRETKGASAARTARTVASLMLGMAVRHGALPTNPVDGVGKISTGGSRKRPRALTVDEEVDLVKRLAADDKQSPTRDVADLAQYMLGTGARIGEVLGVLRSSVDLEAGVLEVDGKAVFRKGRGGVREDWTKSHAGWRVLALPDHVVELSRRRMNMVWPSNERGLLFPTDVGSVWVPNNAAGLLRGALDRIGYEWVTSHTFRKTCATRLDDAGLSARQIADHLGHAQPSMTQDIYMGRGVVSAKAAEALTPHGAE